MKLEQKIVTAFRNKIFIAGLVIRVLFVILFLPEIQVDLFVPFLVNIIETPSLFPWETYLQNNGDLAAFPYGPVMALAHLPFVFIGWIIDAIFSSSIFTLIGFKASLLFADLMLLLILVKMFSHNYKEVLLFYWLSPIVIYVTYIHGQTDIIPITLFTASLLLLKQEKIKKCAIAVGISISAKFSMLVTAPFLILYLIVNKKYRAFSKDFIFWMLATIIALHLPFIFDSGFHEMVLGNEQTNRLFWIYFDFNSVYVFITPLIMLLVLYLIWRQSKINFDLLMAVLSIGFFAIILTGIAPPGWYIWLAPFLVQHQIKHGRTAVLSVSIFSTLLVAFYFTTTPSGYFELFDLNLEAFRTTLLSYISQKNLSILFTLLFGMGIIIIIQILRSGIRENNFFHLANKTLSIGITGGTNSGKNTLSKSIENLFGSHSVSHLSGKNYLKWDKHSPMWKTITHLNPRASLLMKYTNDALDLIHRRDISARLYNAESGYFSKLCQLKSNDIILISGFHALFSKHLRNKLDLKIFLDIDKELRSNLLKNNYKNNDVIQLMDDTEITNDTKKYIDCQKEHADIIFHLQAQNKKSLKDNPESVPQLKLKATIRNGVYYTDLQRAFIGLCNLNASIILSEEIGSATLEIDGDLDFKGEDATLAIIMICPHILEILDIEPKWHNGMLGIMQVIVLAGINQALQEHK